MQIVTADLGGPDDLGPARARHRPAPLLALSGLLVAGIALLPLGYLLIRSSEIGLDRALDIATSDRTRGLLWRTGLLATAVTGAAVLIAVPVAWLTVRTDLPLRRFWVVATALPLAIPTYVGGYAFIGAVGPRGIRTLRRRSPTKL